MPRRSLAAIALVLTLAAASCAKKPVAAPTAPGAPHYPDFIFPAAQATNDVAIPHQAAWDTLQAGDPRGAERQYAALLKRAPDFYPAEAGLGYAALARRDWAAAVSHFDKAIAAKPAYPPALAGKGEALLAMGRTAPALEAFEAALAVDATLTAISSRVDVLKFRGAQQNIEGARKAAESGRLDEARRLYASAIDASPQSGFLYRELAVIDQKAGDSTAALSHAERAVSLDPGDARALQLVAEINEANRAWARAADAYTALNAIEPADATAAKIDQMRERAAFDAMPADYRAIEESPTVTRAQLAALLGVRLEALLRGARSANPTVMTDVRNNWASPWILAVTRAGVMEAFPNHTFEPNASVRRGDLAQAVSRVLTLIGTEKPRLASRWRDARPKFADVAPGHLSYPAAARSVSSGVMSPLEGDTFQLSRAVTGAEAADAVAKLAALAKR